MFYNVFKVYGGLLGGLGNVGNKMSLEWKCRENWAGHRVARYATLRSALRRVCPGFMLELKQFEGS